MNEGSVGRRYARALYGLAHEDGAVAKIGADLDAFNAMLAAAGPALETVLYSPLYTPSERRAVLSKLLPRLEFHRHTANLIHLMVDKDRLSAFADMSRAFRELADLAAGRVRASAVSPAPIDAMQRRRVVEALARATGKEIVLETQVDPSLLGGMVVRVGTWLFDASVRARLEQLKLNLTSNQGQA